MLLLATVAGCESPNASTPPVRKERPTVNVPLELRQSNWRGRGGKALAPGPRWFPCCVGRAATTRPIGCGRTAATASGRTTWPRRLDGANVRYAYVTNGDVKFLEWACRTRRGCGITIMGGGHMVALVHLDDKWAALLDNNAVEKYIWVPRETLIAEWKASDGWAITPVYTPAAPLPQ